LTKKQKNAERDWAPGQIAWRTKFGEDADNVRVGFEVTRSISDFSGVSLLLVSLLLVSLLLVSLLLVSLLLVPLRQCARGVRGYS